MCEEILRYIVPLSTKQAFLFSEPVYLSLGYVLEVTPGKIHTLALFSFDGLHLLESCALISW